MIRKHQILILILLLLMLRAYGQDSVRVVKQYLDPQSFTFFDAPVDTFMAGSQIHHPLYENWYSYTETGNTGAPAIQNRFQGVRDYHILPMLEAYQPYLAFDYPITRYQLLSPFSCLNYNSGGTSDKHGQTVKGIFTRDLSARSKINAQLRYYGTDGHYSRQESTLSTVSANYAYEKSNYRLYLKVARQSIKQLENGGLTNDDDLISGGSASFMPVELASASNQITVSSLSGAQLFDLSAWPTTIQKDTLEIDTTRQILPIRIRHHFTLESVKREYNDQDPLSGFYEHVYLDSAATQDSIKYIRFDQQILADYDRLKLFSKPLNVSAGIRPVAYRYQSADSTFYKFDMGVLGKLNWKNGRTSWNALGEFTFMGYRAGDYLVSLSLDQWFMHSADSTRLRVGGKLSGITPNPFWSTYISNHFEWNTLLNRQSGINLFARVNVQPWKFWMNLQLNIVKGYLYFDENAMPAQLNTSILVPELEMGKKFVLGPLRSNFRAQLQFSTHKEVPIPLVAATNSTFMHHHIHFKATGGSLDLEYGFDVRYTSPFKGYAYMPATSMFFLQDERMMGNYPMLDLFVQVKIKRTRIFVQYNHLLEPLFPQNYFGALHYPYQQANFKYGVYWHFYD